MYYHGESINVNVVVTNNSNKTLRKIRIAGKYLRFFVELMSFVKYEEEIC